VRGGSLWIAIALAICLATHPGFGQSRFTISDEAAGAPGSPQVVVLRDNAARVEAAVAPSEGGELSSYRVQFNGKWIELLFHARDYSPSPGFKGKGPLLWPAVGAQFPLGTVPAVLCGDGSYQVDGKTYPMPCHGFARSLPWKEVSRLANNASARVTLELLDSDRTRPSYPYAFRLHATYELSSGHLSIDYTVTADHSNAEPMPFSIGNHIAFNIPFVKGTDPGSMTLETASTSLLLRNPQGTLSGEQKPRSFEVPERLGDFDARVALPLAGYRGQPYVRLADPQGLSVRVTQQASSSLPEPLVRFVIYGGPQVGYLCPEPWFGIQNSLNLGRGLVKLPAGDTWTWRIELQASTGR
jgi:galactose mutarotase-like enzyme